jgi:hypothetical protein
MMLKGVIVPTVGPHTEGSYEKWKKGTRLDHSASSQAEVDGTKERAVGQNREEPKAE